MEDRVSTLRLFFKDRFLSLHELDKDKSYIIGNEPHCQIPIDSLAIKPHHAVVTFANNQFHIAPDSSDAEVFLNGTPITVSTVLNDGDTINLGKHTIRYSSVMNQQESADKEPSVKMPSQRSGWVQFLNGADMGKTMPVKQSMININHQDKDIALISNRKDGFYLSHLRGAQPPRVNDKEIGDHSVCLKDKCRIQVGPLELMFYLDQPG